MRSQRSSTGTRTHTLCWASIAIAALGLCGCSTTIRDLPQPPPRATAAQEDRSYWTFEVYHLELDLDAQPELSGFTLPARVEDMPRFQPKLPREPDREESLPDRFDWREQGVVGPVQDQGECGSCWAHAACTIAESAAAIQGAPLQEISRDWLINCNVDNWGCHGGQIALHYFVDQLDLCNETGGVLQQDEVAYQSGCHCEDERVARFGSWGMVSTREQSQDIDAIKRVIMQSGPIIATIQISMPFMGYSSGVFNYRSRPFSFGVLHLVVITGWDDNQGSEGIWFVQNSWGEDWGEDGAMRIGYGVSGVAEFAAAIGQMEEQGTGLGQEVADSEADSDGTGEAGARSASVVADKPSDSATDGVADAGEPPADNPPVAEEAGLADNEGELLAIESTPTEDAGDPVVVEAVEAIGPAQEVGGVPSAEVTINTGKGGGMPLAEVSFGMDEDGLPRVATIIENIDYLEAALQGDPSGLAEPIPMPTGSGEGADHVEFDPDDIARGQSGLVGVWLQVDGRNDADVAPGGYLQSVLRVAPSGLLEWSRRHDKGGRLRTVTRLDWKENAGEVIVGQVEMLQKRRMSISLRLPGQGGVTWSILAPTRSLPAKLKWSLQGDVLVLDGRRYRRYRGIRH